jgi:hypothetical protein
MNKREKIFWKTIIKFLEVMEDFQQARTHNQSFWLGSVFGSGFGGILYLIAHNHIAFAFILGIVLVFVYMMGVDDSLVESEKRKNGEVHRDAKKTTRKSIVVLETENALLREALEAFSSWTELDARKISNHAFIETGQQVRKILAEISYMRGES